MKISTNILVLEDHPIQRANLCSLLKEIDKDIALFESDSIEKAIKYMIEYDIDLFYLDIELGDECGLEFAKRIRAEKKYEFTGIVFITSHKRYILEAFKSIHCYDFINKPYNKEEIIQVTSKLLKSPYIGQTKQKKFLVFNVDDIHIKIYIDDIFFIEALGKHSIIHSVHGEYEMKRRSLKSFLVQVKGSSLIQSHRSYIINTKHIYKIDCSNGIREVWFNNYDKPALIGYTYKDKIDDYITSCC